MADDPFSRYSISSSGSGGKTGSLTIPSWARDDMAGNTGNQVGETHTYGTMPSLTTAPNESPTSSVNQGLNVVSTAHGESSVVNTGPIVVESFLRDRPPPVREVPEEPAEIRWGQRSDFEYDLSSNAHYSGTPDFFVHDSEIDGTANGPGVDGLGNGYDGWTRAGYSISGVRPSGDDGYSIFNGDQDEEDPDDPRRPTHTATLQDIQEIYRVTEVVRVTGQNGMYVDIERIVNVIFEMPIRYGPDGSIKEFWRFNMNWGQQ